jgi:hypothetical protein
MDCIGCRGREGSGDRLPQWTDFGGIYASFDLPDFVIVLTSINRKNSISGSTPLLVPR